MADAKWATDERKLHSAYDDISSQRYKSAESTILRHLKKHPKSQPALVLRMVLLERLHSPTPAILKVFDEVHTTGDLSTRGAWWIGNTLRNIQRWDLTLKMYQSFWDAQPERTDLGEQVFLNAAAAWDTAAMVASSRKMFNLVKSSVWARVAAWSEWVQRSPQPSPDRPFAETAPSGSLRISTTLLSTTARPCATSDHLWLRLQILISAGDLEEAYRFAREEGFGGSLARAWWRMEAVPVIFGRMAEKGKEVDWEGEWSAVEEVLKGDKEVKRNYAFYQYLVQCAGDRPELVAKSRDLLKTLDGQIGEKERAPLLALLKVEKDSRAMTDDEWFEMVQTYWKRWGSKGCVVSELEGVVGDDELRMGRQVRMLETRTKEGHTNEKEYRELVNAEIFLVRRQQSGGDAKYYWRLYVEGLQYGLNLPKTDVQLADEIGLVAVQLLIVRWHETPSHEAPLLQAVTCARFIVLKSPSCAHAHFLLIRLHRLLGAPSLIASPLTALKPTEIQLDNLLHPLFERGASEALMGRSTAVFTMYADQAQKMYKRSASDVRVFPLLDTYADAIVQLPDYVKQALEHESYSKIQGIRELASKLANSLSGAILKVEQARMALLSGKGISEETIATLSKLADVDRLMDNRNFELLPEIGGKRPSTRDMTDLGGVVSESWVRTHARLLAALGKFAKGEAVEHVELPEGQALLPAERAVLGSMSNLLQKASRALAASAENGGVENGHALSGASILEGQFQGLRSSAELTFISEPGNMLLRGSFDSMVTPLLHGPTRRGELQVAKIALRLMSFGKLSRMVDLVTQRIDEQAKPGAKGKRKPSTEITELAGELKGAKESLKDRLPEVIEMLDGLVKRDTEIEWTALAADLFEDDKDLLLDTGKQITSARSSAINKLKDLLDG